MLYWDNVAYAQFTDNKQQRSSVCVTACVCDVCMGVFVYLWRLKAITVNHNIQLWIYGLYDNRKTGST